MPAKSFKKQVIDAQARHPDMVLLFRMGDFYEVFNAQAEEVAQVLALTLTARKGMPMCGFPYHALESNLRKLLKHGKRVSICGDVK